MARNFFRIFTENNPVMGYSKTFFIPEAKGLRVGLKPQKCNCPTSAGAKLLREDFDSSKIIH